jgi:hypothetical protein
MSVLSEQSVPAAQGADQPVRHHDTPHAYV